MCVQHCCEVLERMVRESVEVRRILTQNLGIEKVFNAETQSWLEQTSGLVVRSICQNLWATRFISRNPQKAGSFVALSYM
jgi:hypothetical protein